MRINLYLILILLSGCASFEAANNIDKEVAPVQYNISKVMFTIGQPVVWIGDLLSQSGEQ